MKIRFYLLICLAFLLNLSSFSQSNSSEKTYEKIEKLINKNEIDPAEKKLEALLIKDPFFGKGWDMLANIKNYRIKEASENGSLFGNLQFEAKDSDGNIIEGDTLLESLKELMSGNFLEKSAQEEYTNTLRTATLLSEDAYMSSIFLRMENVDAKVDTNISIKALDAFNLAEKEFQKKNYGKAAKMYKKAIKIEPNFYKAILYLGDAFYSQEEHVMAIEQYKIAYEMYPKEMEPVKYLCDAYRNEGLFDESKEMAIESFNIFPDLSMNNKLRYALYYSGKELDIAWMPRGVFPNSLASENLRFLEIGGKEIKANEYWNVYIKAMEDVKEFVNEKGIISENDLTNQKYLELFSWEQMLVKSDDENLAEAKRMQKDGFLDCYVFITCFHFDIYDQYKDFIENNPKKVKRYFNRYIKSL